MTPKIQIFITGDLGKVGSLITNHLKHKYSLVGYDLQRSSKEDIRNYKNVRNKIRGCEYVIHAAAIPGKGLAEPFEYFEVNVEGAHNVMRAAKEQGVKRFIYISSVTAYGWFMEKRWTPHYFPIDERHPVTPLDEINKGMQDIYGVSKLMAENLLSWYGSNHLYQTVAFRLATVAKKSEMFSKGANAERERGWQQTFFTNLDPEAIGPVIESSLTADLPSGFEIFNLCDWFATDLINIKSFLQSHYPEVKTLADFSNNESLLSAKKARNLLGYRPVDLNINDND